MTWGEVRFESKRPSSLEPGPVKNQGSRRRPLLPELSWRVSLSGISKGTGADQEL